MVGVRDPLERGREACEPTGTTRSSHSDSEAALGAEDLELLGASADVRRGSQRIVDRGPILIDGQTGEILWPAGPHPLPEPMNGS